MEIKTVNDFASYLKISPTKLLAQLNAAGMNFTSTTQEVRDADKEKLLKFLKNNKKMLSTPRGILIFKSISLNHIKTFGTGFKATFADDKRLYTVSGANGSGKSTILRALVLAQKAFFADQLTPGSAGHEKYASIVDEEILKYLKSKASLICVNFLLDGASHSLELKKDDSIPRGWNILSSDKEELRRVWNINKPASIILYLDAGKSVLEEEVRYTNLNMPDSNRIDLATRCIFMPQHAFSEMYKQTIQDYILERLVPSSPARTVYQRITHAVFEKLLGTIGITNFTSRQGQQVALLARRISPKKTQAFDIRELSSGEKTLYFTLAYLFLSDTVGTLVIDEPENHFHEHLLLKFAAFLSSLLSAPNLSNFLSSYIDLSKSKATQDSDEHKGWGKKQLEKVYSQHNLSQVFLLTHSKSLIYHSFSLGNNYAITQAKHGVSWAELAEATAETTLREVGLSTTLSRVLFVEGKGDKKLLEGILAEQGVQVRQLGGGSTVKDMFRRLSDVRKDIKGATYGFLIDRDDKPPEYFSELEKHDSDFFKSSFVLLDRHELENYLLDETLFFRAIESERQGSMPIEKIERDKLRAHIIQEAQSAVDSSFRKAACAKIEMAITNLLAQKIWGNKTIDYKDPANLDANLIAVLPTSLNDDLTILIKSKVKELIPIYYNISGDAALARCDGKAALWKLVSHYANHCKVSKDRFYSGLCHQALTAPDTAFSIYVKKIHDIFQETK